jgi:succinate dehydrogenase (ubiquinone) membrane anchor subunit
VRFNFGNMNRPFNMQHVLSFTAAAVSQVGTAHTPDRVHGSYHWTVERAASAALVPIIAAQLAVGASPVTDVLLGVVLPVHLHIGKCCFGNNDKSV